MTHRTDVMTRPKPRTAAYVLRLMDMLAIFLVTVIFADMALLIVPPTYHTSYRLVAVFLLFIVYSNIVSKLVIEHLKTYE